MAESTWREGSFRTAACALLLVSLPAGGCAPQPVSERPSFVFVLADDLGWTETSVRMDPDVPRSATPYLVTPSLERLSREGVRFSNAYAPAAICTPTRRSLLCGMTPARQRGTEFESEFDPSAHLTIPRALKAVDPAYRCAHLGKWGFGMGTTPEDAGYDESDGMTTSRTGTSDTPEARDGSHVDPDPKRTFTVTDRAVDFVKRQAAAGNPFYLQVSYYAVHRKIQARPSTLARYRQKGVPPRTFPPAFAAMVEDLDTGVGRILAALDELGLADRTFVIFSSGNGGSEYDRENPLFVEYARGGGTASPPGEDAALAVRLPANYPLRGTKQRPYEGGIRVPLIVAGPGVAAGTTAHEPVAPFDLLSTLAGLAGGRDPLPDHLDGVSFRPLLEADAGTIRRSFPGIVFHRPAKNYSAIRVGRHKLIVDWGSAERPVALELYDLVMDIGEQRNLSGTMPAKRDELFDLLCSYLVAVDAELPAHVSLAGVSEGGT